MRYAGCRHHFHRGDREVYFGFFIKPVSDDCLTMTTTTSRAGASAASVVNGYCHIVNVSTPKDKAVLQSMKLDFPEGCVTAILGPSGSGKTTLMSVLTRSLPINLKAVATSKNMTNP